MTSLEITFVLPIYTVSQKTDVHPKIRRGLHRARALNEGGLGTNWRFSTFNPPYLRNGTYTTKVTIDH